MQKAKLIQKRVIYCAVVVQTLMALSVTAVVLLDGSEAAKACPTT
jgi:hypothetical protein